MKIAILGAVAIEGETGLTVWFIAFGRIGSANFATVIDHIGTKDADFTILVDITSVFLEMETPASITTPWFANES